MRKKRASPYLTYQAAGFARGPIHATVVSSRTPAPRMGLCTRMDLCRHTGGAAALGTGPRLRPKPSSLLLCAVC